MAKSEPKTLWRPTKSLLKNSNLARYLRWLEQDKSLTFNDYHAARQWSVDNVGAFWESLWRYFKVKHTGKVEQVLSTEKMPGAKWFEGAKLNYADHVFRNRTTRRPAILFQSETQPLTEMSWSELERQTVALAATLKAAGVKKGDRVAAFLPNTPHAIVGVLATASLGAVWSSCSPDFGASSVADRFVQIKPKVLLACDGYSYGGKVFDKQDVVREIVGLLPTVKQVIFVPFANPNATGAGIPNLIFWEEATDTSKIKNQQSRIKNLRVPFDHPLWILYSSGTTGAPKAITHSHGGNLLEHLKYLHFHNDVRPGERFFWFATTGWMMWNFTLAALMAKATIVLYDGSPGFPNLNVLWDLAEKAQITHFGTSAPFLVSCMKASIEPGKNFDLSRLRSIGSTGSPLPPEAFGYVYKNIKKQVWLASMAGGTDVCTAWVGGNPLLPVRQGEIQCRCLGAGIESWDEDGHALPPGEVGELVVTKPMPSMPVFFWNDADGAKYRSSYFEHFPDVWRHGDWVKITENQSLVILGRSDATLNRGGVRIGTAEIYRAMDALPELRDSLIINVERPDGSDWMPLFVALNPGFDLDDDLKNRIRKTLRSQYSPRHVPDEIVAVADIPYTISGKKMETPVKKIFQGKSNAYTPDAMRNPEAMGHYVELAKTQKLT